MYPLPPNILTHWELQETPQLAQERKGKIQLQPLPSQFQAFAQPQPAQTFSPGVEAEFLLRHLWKGFLTSLPHEETRQVS